MGTLKKSQNTTAAKIERPSNIVAIGASAGGIETLPVLLKQIPADTKLAFVILQHMSPDFKTMLHQILTKKSDHRVVLAEDGMEINAGGIYLIPPDKLMTLFHRRIMLQKRSTENADGFFPIDFFMKSLASDIGREAIAVILSGTGSDGCEGIKEIRKSAGYVVAQSPSDAKFSSMPRNAITTEAVHAVLPANEILEHICDYASGALAEAHGRLPSRAMQKKSLNSIYYILRQRFDVDFSAYKPELMERRLEKRLKMAGCEDYDQYYEAIFADAREAECLYEDLLIGVTEFNRHPEMNARLMNSIFPEIKERLAGRDTVRIWCIGCSTGQEAYTLSMMIDQFLSDHKLPLKFKVYATDIDERAIKIASRAIYPTSEIAKLPGNWREKYFHIKDDSAFVKESLREHIVFARHNALKDAPFPKIDLISCRNLMIYLRPETKKSIYSSLRFSLQGGGFLMLGASESMEANTIGYESVDDGPLFRCTQTKPVFRTPSATRLSPSFDMGNPERKDSSAGKKTQSEQTLSQQIYEKIVRNCLPASLVFNASGDVEYLFGGIKDFLKQPSGKISHKLENILPEKIFKTITTLKNSLHGDADRQSDTVLLGDDDGSSKVMKITVTNLDTKHDGRQYYLGEIVVHEDVIMTAQDHNVLPKELNYKVHALESELKNKKKELHQTRNELTSIIDQLEASNEELQTTNEELTAGSEELQSTNEELQAVNEELYTVNAECQLRISELSEMSSDLQNIYNVSEIGTIFVDKNLRIRKYNRAVQSIFNLLVDDIGRPIDQFNMGISTDLGARVKEVMDDMRPFEMDFKARDNRWYLMRIAPYKTENMEVKGAVLVFTDISFLKFTENKLHDAESQLSAIEEVDTDIVIKLDDDGSIVFANNSFRQLFQRKTQRALEIAEPHQINSYFDTEQSRVLTSKIDVWSRLKTRSDALTTNLGNKKKVLWFVENSFDEQGKLSEICLTGRVSS